MQLSTWYCLLWFPLSVLACGPETVAQDSTWMLGTWSSTIPGISGYNCGVTHLEFLADGTLREGGIGCVSVRMPVELDTQEYQWERHDDDEIEVDRGPQYEDRWRIVPGDDCSYMSLQRMHDGQPLGEPSQIYRGAVCVDVIPMCPEGQGECEIYRTVWCGEAPLPCEES
jgi:hypothetical protein